uniref:Uncharacterized protein n=1 Tax=viral metagenome TaxID=1070528 RepID=A0A6C0F0U4_9ZZZZ
MAPLKIKNDDLLMNQYTIDMLEQNINNLSLWTLLKTQHLNAIFCFKYILDSNERYAKDEDDEDICLRDIIQWQPHIQEKEIYSLFTAKG